MKARSRSIRTTLFPIFAVGLLLAFANVASAQQLYSFETPDNPGTPAVDESLEGWGLGWGTTAVTFGASTEAATDGTHGMKIEKQPGYTWDLTTSIGPGDTVRYPLWNTVASNLAGYALEFDVITTADSFANLTDFPPTGYFLLDVSVNSSTGPNFPTVFNIAPPGNFYNPANPSQTYHSSIPMTSLPVGANSTYYQLNLGSNSSSYTPGPQGQGLRYFVDNVRFRALPPPKEEVSETLFSWETADNPGTPAVDERFENWTTGFQPGHAHSIVTSPAPGPTHGTHALNIHRVDLDNAPDNEDSAYFTWGSQYVLNSDTDPGPGVTIDPVIQQQINQLSGKLKTATRVAFDVTFDPATFDGSSTFAILGLGFTDNIRTFQAQFPFFNPANLTSLTTLTMDLPLTAFVAGSLNLAQQGLTPGTNFLRIALSTNANGLFAGGASTPIDLQIDNFRLITELSGVAGDYNNNNVVDAADYVLWRKMFPSSTFQLLNEADGVSEGSVALDDYAAWRARFGNVAPTGSGAIAVGGSVPEPTGLVFVAWALIGCLGAARRQISKTQRG